MLDPKRNTRVTFDIQREIFKKLKVFASREEISVAALLRKIVREFLKNN